MRGCTIIGRVCRYLGGTPSGTGKGVNFLFTKTDILHNTGRTRKLLSVLLCVQQQGGCADTGEAHQIKLPVNFQGGCAIKGEGHVR